MSESQRELIREIREPNPCWLLLFFLALYALTAAGRIDSGDEETMYRVTSNLVERGEIAVEQETVTLEEMSHRFEGLLPTKGYSFLTNYATPGRGGHTYSKYGLGQSLAVVPLYLVGRVWGSQYAARLCVALFNPLVTALTCWLIFVFARSLGFSGALWLSLAYGLSTMAWAYNHTFYSQPATTFLLLGAAYTAHRYRRQREERWLLLAGVCLGGAILFRMASLIALPAFGLYLLFIGGWKARGVRRLNLFLGPVAGALLLTAGYNLARFGSVFETGYTEVAWTTPFTLGLYGLLFSSGKGFFIYNPVLVLSVVGWIVLCLDPERRAESLLFAWLFLAYLLFHASYDFWTGGWNWGPRFLLPAVPGLVLSIGPLLEDERVRGARTAMALLFVAGLLIQTPALLVDHSRYLISLRERYPADFYDRSIYQPDLSPVIQQWPMTLEVGRLFASGEGRAEIKNILAEKRSTVIGHEEFSNAMSDQLLWQSEFLRLNVPDFWWVHLYLLGILTPAILVIVLLLALLVGISGLSLWRYGLEIKSPG